MQMLKVFFSGLMVAGAVGCLIANVIEKGPFPVSMQLIGAALLYMGAADEEYLIGIEIEGKNEIN